MATSINPDVRVSISSDSQPDSPTDTTHLMSKVKLQRNVSNGYERKVFNSPRFKMSSLTSKGRFPSPRITSRHVENVSSPRTPTLVRSVSENLVTNSHWRRNNVANVPKTASPNMTSSMIVSSPITNSQHGETTNVEHGIIDNLHRTPQQPRPSTSSNSDVKHVIRSSSIRSEVLVGTRLSRSSTQRSFGREWTRSHWEKVRDLEHESERARRCSKLSSGFAPLMVFGGLVFVCIGVSATTNTGKDKERLQKLSAAPMAMGVFMLSLGIFLIASWFGCRGRAKELERKLLHGSRRGSIDNNMVQNLISKLYVTTGINRGDAPSPTLPGVTLDGVDVLKPLPDAEVRRHDPVPPSPTPPQVCCTQCGAANASAHAILETAI